MSEEDFQLLLESAREAGAIRRGERKPARVTSEPRCGGYVPRRPETTPLYAALSAGVETFLARREEEERTLPRFVARELRGYLDCGILAEPGQRSSGLRESR